MSEYEVVFVADFVMSPRDGVGVRVPNATALVNERAAGGWTPISIVPGTNAQTYGGLFITFRRG